MRAHLYVMLAGTATVACCSGTESTETGTAVIQARTIGGDIDLDGYVVVVDQDRSYPLLTFGTVEIPDLPTGDHQFVLEGIAPNCDARDGVIQTASIAAAAPTSIRFEVECHATGVRVGTIIDGLDQDLVYYLTLDGVQRTEAVDANGFRNVTRLSPGTYAVRLVDVADNCRIEQDVATVVVEFRKVTPVSFTGHCVAATGVVLVRIAATGEDVDQSGYTVSVPGTSAVFGLPGEIIAVPNVQPGSRMVQVNGISPNCQVSGLNPREVTVTAGTAVRDTAEIDLEVSCTRFWGLALLRSGRLGFATQDGQKVDVSTLSGGRMTWSPDGRRLAFSCSVICIMDLDAPGVTTLLTDDLIAEDVAWSPDGTTLLFTASTCPAFYNYYCDFAGLRLMSVEGGPATRVPLPATVLWAASSAWAPDGTRIAFSCQLQGRTDYKICVVRPDGSDFAQLTNGTGFDTRPAWSPDGTRIAFATGTPTGDPEFTVMEIVVMNADGTGLRHLSPTAYGTSPAWSPDGSRIVYASTDPATFGLTVVNPDGSNPVRLTSRPFDNAPAWRP